MKKSKDTKKTLKVISRNQFIKAIAKKVEKQTDKQHSKEKPND